MERAPIPLLTDGVILLHTLTLAHAAAHLAGEDEEMAKWLNGGHSTAATVKEAILEFGEQWRTKGPRRAFGVFDARNEQLIGFTEANLEILRDPAKVNVSYGIFSPWRGRGLAGRAIDLVAEYLRSATEASEIVLRIAPGNVRSIRVAEKAGFVRVGIIGIAPAQQVYYVRKL
jgi:RimJ/RimL family protein N-acetyltransferase